MAAEPGVVSSQAHTMRPAMAQRTADGRRVAPTPTIAPVMVWVVLMPMPSAERLLVAADPERVSRA